MSVFDWWLRCQNRHVAAMGKGGLPLAGNIHDIEYWQPPRKYALPKGYQGPALCSQCGSQLPLVGSQIISRFLVKGPPPADFGPGDPVRKTEPE